MPENHFFKPKFRQSDLVTQQVKKEMLIYDLRNNKAFCLNETAAAVWQKCDGKTTLIEITLELRDELGDSVTNEFLTVALEQLFRDKLLETDTEFAKIFSGISRREMIRRVGQSSLVALPIVTSLVAPTASNAQSTTCPASPCRCTNGTATSCNGSTSGPFVNCFSASGNIPNCNCVGPFGAPDSAGAGYKTGFGCMLE